MKKYTIEDLKAAYHAGGNVTTFSDMGFDTKWNSFADWYMENYVEKPETSDDIIDPDILKRCFELGIEALKKLK